MHIFEDLEAELLEHAHILLVLLLFNDHLHVLDVHLKPNELSFRRLSQVMLCEEF